MKYLAENKTIQQGSNLDQRSPRLHDTRNNTHAWSLDHAALYHEVCL